MYIKEDISILLILYPPSNQNLLICKNSIYYLFERNKYITLKYHVSMTLERKIIVSITYLLLILIIYLSLMNALP